MELLAVIAVMGLMLAVVLPRLPSLEGRSLESDSERLSLLVAYIGERSVSTRSYYRVTFDLDSGAVRVEASRDGAEYSRASEPPLRGMKMSRGVRIEEVLAPALGRLKRGEAAVLFAPSGAVPFEVALSSASGTMRLAYNPYTGKVVLSSPGKDADG